MDEDPAIAEATKIIDRLLILLDSADYNAVDDAVKWLCKHTEPETWLSVRTRDLMAKSTDDSALKAECAKLTQDRGIAYAIQHVREVRGMPLKDAKAWVEGNV